MAIDSIGTIPVVTPGFNGSPLPPNFQFENESATSNLVRDAVKQTQEATEVVERRNLARRIDVFV